MSNTEYTCRLLSLDSASTPTRPAIYARPVGLRGLRDRRRSESHRVQRRARSTRGPLSQCVRSSINRQAASLSRPPEQVNSDNVNRKASICTSSRPPQPARCLPSARPSQMHMPHPESNQRYCPTQLRTAFSIPSGAQARSTTPALSLGHRRRKPSHSTRRRCCPPSLLPASLWGAAEAGACTGCNAPAISGGVFAGGEATNKDFTSRARGSNKSGAVSTRASGLLSSSDSPVANTEPFRSFALFEGWTDDFGNFLLCAVTIRSNEPGAEANYKNHKC